MKKASKETWIKRIDEFRDKKICDGSEADSLIAMIQSSDNENAYMVTLVAKQFIKKALSTPLNSGQKEAFESIVEYLDTGKEKAVVLRGYAGTGKTFLIKQVIEYIIQTEETSKVAITAPTNKAVKVLFKGSAKNNTSSKGYMFNDLFDSSSRLVYSTIHKLLALKEVIAADGSISFQSDDSIDRKAELSNYNYLIVDEVSMLDDKLTELILMQNNLKIIFLGDPCQIPQIGKGECLPFSKNPKYLFKYAELTEIMRQKDGNAIVDKSFIIRKNLNLAEPFSELKSSINDKKEGIVVLDSIINKDLVRTIFKQYVDTDKFRENPDYFKILAWRNDTIRYVNSVVREVLYGTNVPRFVIGERLIAQKPIFEKVTGRDGKEYWKVMIPNSEELLLEKIDTNTEYFDFGFVLFYNLTVSYYDVVNDRNIKAVIKVVHEDSQILFNENIEKLKQTAIKAKRAFIWIRYYDLLKHDADIAYNYALSVHKSQGSTYENVFLLEEDLNKNPKIVERNRIKYTAYTRASKKLYVLRKGDPLLKPYKDYRTEDYTSCGPT